MHIKDLTANWNYPTRIWVGAGRIQALAQACHTLSIKAPLIVTDPGLANLPIADTLISCLEEAGLSAVLFTGIKSNPTGENISSGVRTYKSGQHDGIIAFGGGSALDAGKAIALMSGQQGSLWDFEDVGDNWKAVNAEGIAPVIAIPTTAGTGSETGRASVITDQAQQIKKIIFHPKMLPEIVIMDPELTIHLPPQLTAATGMDALSHNLEAYCAPGYHPMAEGIAAEGIALIKTHLPLAFNDGHDLIARAQMLVASAMGSTAFQRGLGAMHALSHPLGALYDAHHGRLNAVLMPYVLKANRAAIEARIERLAAYLQIDNGFDGFLHWILALRRDLAIEHSLADIGIDGLQISRIAQMAIEDAAALSNPIIFNKGEYEKLLAAAIDGRLDLL